MAFNLWKWITKSLSGDSTQLTGFLDEETVITASTNAWIEIMAFNACVSKIAAAVGSCEFETYSKDMLTKSNEYWLWNYSPNPNQNKRQFFEKLIFKLYSNEEALVVKSANGSMFVADGYSTIHGDISGDSYENVMIGTTKLNQFPYRSSDVIKLKLEGGGIGTVLSGIADAESKLIDAAQSAYVRNAGRHGVLNISDTASAETDFKDKYTEIMNTRMSKYYKAENAVLPLFEGYKYTPDNGTSSGTETSAINTMLANAINLTAAELGVPASIANGTGATEQEFNNFMTYTVKPLAEMIQTEANRKLYGMQNVTSGNYMHVDMASVKYSDVFSLSNSIDKLISSGCFSINDILLRLSEKTIDEPWANQHWMTKNYSPAEQVMNGQGGENGT